MQAFLEGFLPRVLPRLSFDLHALGGKRKLLEKIPCRLRGYAHWLPETWRIIVLVDQDNQNCHDLKTTLEDFARTAGLPTATHPSGETVKVVNRIVIPCLEAWYFGDWGTVCRAYPRVPRDVPYRARYRNPDMMPDPARSFEQIMQRAGYFRTGLRKIEAAREIGSRMEAVRNTSHSFQVFYRALQSLQAW